MMLPLIIMAIGAATAGYIPFGKYVSTDGKPLESHFDLSFSILPVVLGFAGIVSAWILYKKQNPLPDKLCSSFGALYKASYHKFYIDEIYLFITKKVIFNLIGSRQHGSTKMLWTVW
jgi:NADH-quinone oxidoreductase subunit L